MHEREHERALVRAERERAVVAVLLRRDRRRAPAEVARSRSCSLPPLTAAAASPRSVAAAPSAPSVARSWYGLRLGVSSSTLSATNSCTPSSAGASAASAGRRARIGLEAVISMRVRVCSAHREPPCCLGLKQHGQSFSMTRALKSPGLGLISAMSIFLRHLMTLDLLERFLPAMKRLKAQVVAHCGSNHAVGAFWAHDRLWWLDRVSDARTDVCVLDARRELLPSGAAASRARLRENRAAPRAHRTAAPYAAVGPARARGGAGWCLAGAPGFAFVDGDARDDLAARARRAPCSRRSSRRSRPTASSRPRASTARAGSSSARRRARRARAAPTRARVARLRALGGRADGRDRRAAANRRPGGRGRRAAPRAARAGGEGLLRLADGFLYPECKPIADAGPAHADGLAFSADGRTLFVADRADATLRAYDYPSYEDGLPELRARVAPAARDAADAAAAGRGRAAGATADADGGYWSCRAGRRRRRAPPPGRPRGRRARRAARRARDGGRDRRRGARRHAHVATSRSAARALQRPGADDDAHELAGALFAVDLAPLGLRASRSPRPST